MAPPAAAGPPTASAKALAEELKRQLMGDAAISVEPRGERVVVSIAEASLFTGNATAVGQEGFRLLYRFGKGIKNVRDRRIVVGITSSATRPRAWIIAAARGVSLGRFLLDDLSVSPPASWSARPPPRRPEAPRPRAIGSSSRSSSSATAAAPDRDQRDRRRKKSQAALVLTMKSLLAPTTPQPRTPAPVPQPGSPNQS